MSRILISLVCMCCRLVADWDQLFVSTGDPTLVENVNVITGNLNLSFQDVCAQGALLLALHRTYSSKTSDTAKEVQDKIDLSGGWTLFPQLDLYIEPVGRNIYAYAMEPTGALIGYRYTWKNFGVLRVFHPMVSRGPCFGVLSGRNNPSNHTLYIDLTEGRAILELANGGRRIYQGSKSLSFEILRELGLPKGDRSYRIQEEVLPSGHRIRYEYLGENEVKIRLCSPRGDRTYASIEARRDRDLVVTTSNHREYRFVPNKKGNILKTVSSTGPVEQFHYTQKRLESFSLGGEEVFHVDYYEETGKVRAIYTENGAVATFEYKPKETWVWDIDQRLTVYRHDYEKLTEILYENERRERFFWHEGFLVAKELTGPEESPIVRKQFIYDEHKNVIEESIQGNLTGLGFDRYTKQYVYDKKGRLLLEEHEQEGPSYTYEYLSSTDLVRHKYTWCGDTIVWDEETIYDEENLVIGKRSAGRSEEYIRDPTTKMVIKTVTDVGPTEYTYDRFAQVIEERTPWYTIAKGYDRRGRVVRRTNPLGGINTYTYDDWGNTVDVKEVGFPKKTFIYDKGHRPIACVANGMRSENRYDAKGRRIAEIGKYGDETRYSYNNLGECIKKELPLGMTTYYEYDTQGNCILERTERGETRTEYTVLRKPFHIVYPDGSEVWHRYYKNGELRETVEVDGSKVCYEYDRLHRLVSRDRSGRKDVWEYEGALLKRHTDCNGLETVYEYDPLQRKVAEVCGGRKKSFAYDQWGNVTSVVQGDLALNKVYDVEGRLIEESESGYKKTCYLYDEEGRKRKAIRGDAVDRMEYDAEGRLVLHTDPLGHQTRIAYGPRSKTVIDPLGHTSVETYDALGRAVRKERFGDVLSDEQFVYNRAGDLVKRLTPVYLGQSELPWQEIIFTHDRMGRVITEDQGCKVTQYAYDKKGRLTKKTDPSGVSLYYEYNVWNEVTHLYSSDGTIDYVYDREGLKERVNQVFERTYTPWGELASDRGMNWSYDDVGRVTRMELPDHSSIQYTYVGPCMTKVARGGYAHEYTEFDRNQHVVREKQIDGSETTSTWDLLERPEQMQSRYHKEGLHFGASGLIIKTLDSLRGDRAYAYDSLGQLIREGDLTYEFDSLGNSAEYMTNRWNQIVSKAFSYDKAGNLVRQGGRQYTYDALGRLTQLVDGERAVKYAYDPWSRLVSREERGHTVYYLYDRDFEIGTMDEHGKLYELKVLGLGVKGEIGAAVAMELEGEVFLPLHDLQGNVIALARQSGGLYETYSMNAFGEGEKGVYLNPWRFASKRADLGLVYFGRRFYDPALKRWLTPDPLGFKDSRNPYQYTLNSPLNRLDLFGLEAIINFGFDGGKMSGGIQVSNCGYINPLPSAHGNYLMPTKLVGRGTIDGCPVNVMVICNRVYDLHFTPEEYRQGHFNLFDHIHELMAGVDEQIAAFTYGNGIDTSYQEWMATGDQLAQMLPKGALFMSVHNPAGGLMPDLFRAASEIMGTNTKSVQNLRGLHTEILDMFAKHQLNGKGLHMPHSEGGLIYNKSFEGMAKKQQDQMREYFYCEAIGPAQKVPRDYGIRAKNTYSNADYITGLFKGRSNDKYEVEWVRAQSPASERVAYFADHTLLGTTYRNVLGGMIGKYEENIGFYVGNHR